MLLYAVGNDPGENAMLTVFDVDIETLGYTSGVQEWQITGHFARSWGIAFDGTNLWITDPDEQTLDKFSLDGTLLETHPQGPFPYNWQSIKDVTWDGTWLWVVTNFQIHQVDPATGGKTGTFIDIVDAGADDPLAIASDKAGAIYLSYKDGNFFNEPHIARHSGGAWGAPVHNIDFGTGSSMFDVNGLEYSGGWLIANSLSDGRIYRLDFDAQDGDPWFNTIDGPQNVYGIAEVIVSAVIPPLRLIQRDDLGSTSSLQV